MKAFSQHFTSKVRTASASYEAQIQLHHNKLIISRFGTLNDLPEETQIDFKQVSDIIYGKSGGRSWISFRLREHPMTKPAPTSFAVANIPYSDPYSIIFGVKKEACSAEIYAAIKKAFDEFDPSKF